MDKKEQEMREEAQAAVIEKANCKGHTGCKCPECQELLKRMN